MRRFLVPWSTTFVYVGGHRCFHRLHFESHGLITTIVRATYGDVYINASRRSFRPATFSRSSTSTSTYISFDGTATNANPEHLMFCLFNAIIVEAIVVPA
jgi:hypothetical protein